MASWRDIGKRCGIGLSDEEKVDRARARRMASGRATPQEQLELVSGRLNRQGQYGEYDAINPGQARYANQFASRRRAAGTMGLEGSAREPQMGPRREENMHLSGKPLSEWTSDEVKEMQRNMNAGGYVDAKGEQLKVDGMIGRKTVAAMRSVQQANFEADTGPYGDYSQIDSGIGAGETAIRGGARGHDAGAAETPREYPPSVMQSAKNVGKSYGDYFRMKQGWIPDVWQR